MGLIEHLDHAGPGDEEILERELVAGGTAQANGVPDVGPLDVLGAYQHRPLERHAVTEHPHTVPALDEMGVAGGKFRGRGGARLRRDAPRARSRFDHPLSLPDALPFGGWR